MRLNDDGITEILNVIKTKWNYLKVSSSGDDAVLYLTSSTVTGNTLVLVFTLNTLTMNGESITTSALTQTLGATVLESSESFTSILKDNLTQYRFTYTINLNR